MNVIFHGQCKGCWYPGSLLPQGTNRLNDCKINKSLTNFLAAFSPKFIFLFRLTVTDSDGVTNSTFANVTYIKGNASFVNFSLRNVILVGCWRIHVCTFQVIAFWIRMQTKLSWWEFLKKNLSLLSKKVVLTCVICHYIDGFVQDCGISIADTLEFPVLHQTITIENNVEPWWID